MDQDFDTRPLQQKWLTLKRAMRILADDRKIRNHYPEIASAAIEMEASEGSSDEEQQELAFLNLYCQLHRAGSDYTRSERSRLDNKKGYFNHPGGISPLLKAEPFITPSTTSADLGAGNGLQGLLFQYLYPHRTTLLVELSAEMIRIGQYFQQLLGIADDRVIWIHDDIVNVSLSDIDFLYLYRPSKPIADGIELYRHLARCLRQHQRPLVIFSIADCLRDFLDADFEIFYSDGHLTCFRKADHATDSSP